MSNLFQIKDVIINLYPIYIYYIIIMLLFLNTHCTNKILTLPDTKFGIVKIQERSLFYALCHYSLSCVSVISWRKIITYKTKCTLISTFLHNIILHDIYNNSNKIK